MGKIINATCFIVLFCMVLLPWFISCKKEFSCENCIAGNMIPVAMAGQDQQLSLPLDSTWLNGASSSDPDGKIVEWQWSKISGPGSFNLIRPTDSITLVKSLTAGSYEFELRIKDDGGLIAMDTLKLFVVDPGLPNRPPVANAGDDTTYTLSASVSLDGSGSYDPDNNIVDFQWTVISGGLSLSIVNRNAVRTEVRDIEAGVHSFELKVTDAFGLFSRDTIVMALQTTEQQAPLCSNLNRPKVPAYLKEIGQLPILLAGGTIAAAGNKIVIVGSVSETIDNLSPSRVEIYDISTNSWATAELSKPRFGIATITVGNKIFFAGGENGDGAFNEVFSDIDIYDVSTNEWTAASLSIPRSYIASAVVDNKVIFAGGEINDYQATDLVDIYDLNTNSWSTERLSQARSGMTAVTVGDNVYFGGGWVTRYWDYIPSKSIDIYNNISGNWKTASLKELSGSVAGLSVDNKIFWANSCKVEIWDLRSDDVRFDSLHVEANWEVNEGKNALLTKNRLVFYGYSSSSFYKDFDIYDLSSSTWSIGDIGKFPMNHQSVIAVNGEIYVFGSTHTSKNPKLWKLEF